MKKIIVIALLAVSPGAYAQTSPPGQSTPQEREAMMEKDRSDRDEELLREKRMEDQQKQQTQIMQQQLDLLRKQLDLQSEQLDLQRKQFELQGQQQNK